jgi:hypothetical protein
VFQNDDAQEVLDEVAGLITREVDGFHSSDRVGVEDISAVLACMKIEASLVRAEVIDPRSMAFANEVRTKMERLVAEEGAHLSHERRSVIGQVLAANIEPHALRAWSEINGSAR